VEIGVGPTAEERATAEAASATEAALRAHLETLDTH